MDNLKDKDFLNELKSINSSLINHNKMLSVFLILALSHSDFKSKSFNEIKTIIPNYTEVLRTISESIKWKQIIMVYQLYIINGK